MPRILDFFTSIALSVTLASAVAAEDRALLIGVGKYELSKYNLPGIDKDINMMRQVARNIGFSDRQIMVIRDSEATLYGIRQAMRSWVIEGVSAGDRVLFYYTGHGSQVPDTSGDEDDRADEVLVPYDFRIGNGTLENVLIDDEFGRLLSQIPSRKVVVFLDSCHSGTATKALRLDAMNMRGRASTMLPKGIDGSVVKLLYYSGMPETGEAVFASETKAPTRNHVALTASMDSEVARATRGGSLFTQGIAQAVAESLRRNQPLTLSQLRDRVTVFISNSVSESAQAHHPQISGDTSRAGENILSPSRVTASDLWRQLEALVDGASYTNRISTHQQSYRLGENLMVTCEVPEPGYLNVINVGEGEREAVVLFPNKYHPDNYVRTGETVTIPSSEALFSLPAQLPMGMNEQRNLIVVFHTKERFNAYAEGLGTGPFKLLSSDLLSNKSFFVRGNYGAGKTITLIRR